MISIRFRVIFNIVRRLGNNINTRVRVIFHTIVGFIINRRRLRTNMLIVNIVRKLGNNINTRVRVIFHTIIGFIINRRRLSTNTSNSRRNNDIKELLMYMIPLETIINSHATTNLLHEMVLIIKLSQFIRSELQWIEFWICGKYT